MKEKLAIHYGVDLARLVAMPFSPSPFLDGDAAEKAQGVLSKYGLESGYYYYPAQFWPHKNHVRILQALEILQAQGHRRLVVFSGKDHGNLRFIMAEATRRGVAESVRALGFVPPEDVRGLYENCLALVMPTYFGPTNIPPLEAWTVGRPVVYSSHLAEQVGDAALLADADSAEELAAALAKLEDPFVRETLVRNGFERLRQVEHQRLAAEEALRGCLDVFSKRMECRPTRKP